MKKIMIAMDAEKPDQKGVVFATYLARLTGSALTGIFLDDLPEENGRGVKFAYGGVYVETIDTFELPEKAFKENVCQVNIQNFKGACAAEGVACKVHRDQGVPQRELIGESRYADLILTGPALFASSALEMPGGIVKELLAKSECPVMIIPHHAQQIDKILFACDGSASALFAIKQFTYLLPELKGTDITVLQADEGGGFREELKEKLYEYLTGYYSRINFKDLRGKAKDELFDYTLREVNSCLIMGAYGRSWLSGLFNASTADLVIKMNNLPVFIAHR